ncbi:MAG: phosphoglucosamine mutase, partial [Anaerolineae bacterium]
MDEIQFGADGIRGIVGYWPFDERGPTIIGRALGQYLTAFSPQPQVVLGRDTRASGREIVAGLTTGLRETGVHVLDVGIMTTPGVAYLTRHTQADLGISVSASHNPPQYNGIKLVDYYGLRLKREDEMAIEKLVAEPAGAEWYPVIVSGQWTDASHLQELYLQDHAPRVRAHPLQGFRVVLDCAHGAATAIAPEAFRRLGAEVIAVHADVDGNHINVEAGSEHVRRHPEDLIRSVREHNATYGFAFDGDGDRLAVVDAQGHLFTGDDLLFALAVYFHAHGQLQGNTVVTTETMNRGLDAALAHFGIRVIRVGKGDKAIEEAMWS